MRSWWAVLVPLLGCGGPHPGDACTTAHELYCDDDNALVCDGSSVAVAFACPSCDGAGDDTTQLICGPDQAHVAVPGSPCAELDAAGCAPDRTATVACRMQQGVLQWVPQICDDNFTCKHVGSFDLCQ